MQSGISINDTSDLTKRIQRNKSDLFFITNVMPNSSRQSSRSKSRSKEKIKNKILKLNKRNSIVKEENNNNDSSSKFQDFLSSISINKPTIFTKSPQKSSIYENKSIVAENEKKQQSIPQKLCENVGF